MSRVTAIAFAKRIYGFIAFEGLIIAYAHIRDSLKKHFIKIISNIYILSIIRCYKVYIKHVLSCVFGNVKLSAQMESNHSIFFNYSNMLKLEMGLKYTYSATIIRIYSVYFISVTIYYKVLIYLQSSILI